MKVIITGAQGQLGWELQRSCPADVSAIYLTRNELDICDSEMVAEVVKQHNPDALINAAAYTAVDKAEEDSEKAFLVNETGVKNLAEACRQENAYFLHVSTDFIFDGAGPKPYSPEASANPIGIYGESKLAGEIAIQNTLASGWAIIRTAWVYSSHGGNFVKTMLRLMGEKPSLGVVADQIGTPTWANGLALVCWKATLTRLNGVHHWTDAGVASWYDFAIAIQNIAFEKGILKNKIPVNPITTEDFPTPAKRPAYSVLDKQSIITALELDYVHWQDHLRNMLEELTD